MKVSYYLLTTFMLIMPVATMAKPDMTPLGKNIADTKSAYYEFITKDIYAKETKHNYRIWIGVPKKLPLTPQKSQKTAYPVLYMLDGNSAMAKLNEPTLQYLAYHKPTVLVAIGYQTNLPFELTARTLDYTPPNQGILPTADPNNAQRLSGGSHKFRKFLEGTIVPWVNSQAKIDPKRTALWGHSYGGLYVLDSLQNSLYFTHYYSASPSLSWADNRPMNKIKDQPILFPANKKLLLLEGDAPKSAIDKASPHFSEKQLENLKTTMAMTQEKGVDSKLVLYPYLSHGEVFGASLNDILWYHFF